LKSQCHKDIKLCLLGLLDGRPNKESMRDFDKHFKALEEVANSKLSKHYEFGWVNATCQQGFASHFNAYPETLPGAVAILPSVNKYAIMFGSFEKENIKIFVDRLLEGKIPLENFDNEKIYLRNAVNCFEVKDEENFVSDFEEDEIIKELLEESRQKRKHFEEEREKLLNEQITQPKKDL
jgi:hypothetical protein